MNACPVHERAELAVILDDDASVHAVDGAVIARNSGGVTRQIQSAFALRDGYSEEDSWQQILVKEYARRYYYVGTLRWPTGNERRQFLNLWVRRGFPPAAATAEALRAIADTYEPAVAKLYGKMFDEIWLASEVEVEFRQLGV